MMATATENVYTLHENFYLPNLDRHRRLWVYLPQDYETSGLQYPVIYMHDGQNLFDEMNAFGNEWGIDETLDEQHGKVIVVGIDNGEEHRMAEYMLHDHPDHGPAEGAKYLVDIVETLKPFVDAALRTEPGKEYTCMAGSSMGGLISLYAGLYFPQIFGVLGIFSPALWLDAPKIFTEMKDRIELNLADETSRSAQRWYFYAGAMETETLVAEVAATVQLFKQYPQLDVTYQVNAGGTHDENVWKDYFPGFYKWFIGKKPSVLLAEESDVKLV